jgi:2-polyprenyl-3-methyl-5-hydroxy-6-metoxy-1,4-benzoquinol methylase
MENSFDIHALTWDENPRRIRMVEEVSEVIFREIALDKNQRILDYGCGTGLLGYSLIERVGEVVFSDTSEGMLEQVKRKKDLLGYQNVTIVKADLLNDHLSGRFDSIFSMLVLHHVDDIENLLRRFYEQLNPGGAFCWIDLDKEDGSFHNDNTIPHFGFERNEAENMLNKAGLKPFFYTNELFIVKEVEGELRQFPLFILAARKD